MLTPRRIKYGWRTCATRRGCTPAWQWRFWARARPPGPKPQPVGSVDDMVLELAVAANCDFIVTYNKKDFQGAERFGIGIVTPKEFLEEIGELP